MGFQAFLAENLLCLLQLLILLTCRERVIKQGLRHWLYWGRENQGFLRAETLIISECLSDQQDEQRLALWTVRPVSSGILPPGSLGIGS